MTKTICFTGHRKLEGSYRPTPTHRWVKGALHKKIEDAYNSGFTHFISGGAVGVDQIAALEVLQHRLTYVDITLTIAIPVKSQGENWPDNVRQQYTDILGQADEVVVVSDGDYSANKMIIRNNWMVDRSDALVAVWDGREKGGTYRTVKYAKDKSIPVLHINPLAASVDWIIHD